MEKLMTAAELADALGVSRATVYNLMNRGMPSIKVGRSRRFYGSECEAWLRSEQGVAM